MGGVTYVALRGANCLQSVTREHLQMLSFFPLRCFDSSRAFSQTSYLAFLYLRVTSRLHIDVNPLYLHFTKACLDCLLWEFS